MAVTDYRLVAERTPDNLTTKVALLITEGWEPLGAPVFNPLTSEYGQALIKGAAAGDGGEPGASRLADLTDVSLGNPIEMGVGHGLICIGGNETDGYVWANFNLSETIENNVVAQLNARKAAAVDPQSPTAAADIIAALQASGLMAAAN